MNKEGKSVLIFTTLGVLAGIVSSYLEKNLALFVGALVLIGSVFFFMKLFKEKVQWFFGNGIIIYVFVWIITWTIALA